MDTIRYDIFLILRLLDRDRAFFKMIMISVNRHILFTDFRAHVQRIFDPNSWVHDDSSNGNIFRVTGHLWRGALMFSLICVLIHGWINNREVDALRRYRTHYDVTVMSFPVDNRDLFLLVHELIYIYIYEIFENSVCSDIYSNDPTKSKFSTFPPAQLSWQIQNNMA